MGPGASDHSDRLDEIAERAAQGLPAPLKGDGHLAGQPASGDVQEVAAGRST
jgi:hypothetical protein